MKFTKIEKLAVAFWVIVVVLLFAGYTLTLSDLTKDTEQMLRDAEAMDAKLDELELRLGIVKKKLEGVNK